VNKLDRVGSDFPRVLGMIRERLGARVVPLTWPIGAEKDLRGVVDVLAGKAYLYNEDDQGTTWREEPVPEDLKGIVAELHHEAMEAAAEQRDDLMEKYLEDENLTTEEIVEGLRLGTITHKLVPAYCGSAFKNKGVQPVLDGVGRFLPSPDDLPPVEGAHPEKPDEKVVRPPDSGAPLAALAFKLVTDSHGELTFLRIYSGVLETGMQLYNPRRNRVERIGRLYILHAETREAVEKAGPGSIVGVVGLKHTVTGDTLCPKHHPILLEGMAFPETVISVAVEPKSSQDRDKLIASLAKIAREDPTFRRHTDEETGQLILSGMGELHLEIVTHRLERDFKIGVNVGRPRVSYKQRIRRAIEIEGRFIRQTGGRGQYGHVVLHIEPHPETMDVAFASKVVGGTVPKEYWNAVEQGVRAAAAAGGQLGIPVVGVSVELTDGSFHAVDSSELAFSAAGEIAFRDGLREAGVEILEPIMRFEVTVPNDYLRGVIADLGSRRAQITKLDLTQEPRIVRGTVPLSEMFGYSTVLRSITQGRAAFSLEPSEYTPVPTEVRKKLGLDDA